MLLLSVAFIAVVVGVPALSWGADHFVNNGARLAKAFQISPALIGMSLIAFGTSAPELMVSLRAVLAGHPNIAAGNALGSNLANMGLVLPCTLLFFPKNPIQRMFTKEIVLLGLVTTGAGLCLYDNKISLGDALALLSGLVFVVFFFWKQQKNKEKKTKKTVPYNTASPLVTFGHCLFGLLVLLFGARALLWGAVEIARSFGISELTIGLTLIAVGTSLPELATSLAGVRKGHIDLAIGNILGSNIFNLLLILPLPGLYKPKTFPLAFFERDYLTVLAMTIFSSLILLWWTKSRWTARLGGSLLLIAYLLYWLALVFTS